LAAVQHLAHWDEVEGARREAGHIAGTWRDLGTATGTAGVGLALIDVDPGKWSTPAHVEGASEEIFLGDEEHALRPGHVVGRPPGTGVAHSFRAGASDLVLLVYGTREPNDICWYPRSRKISLRGIGVIGRIEQAGYWDGEP
jgi:uncharacterized cupin superfamily protein